MGQPAEKRYPATYADLEAVPPHKVAELIRGTLYVFPRPAPPHAAASAGLHGDLHSAFDSGRRGPGGWRIRYEPELHLGPRGEDAVVPDLAGWRIERYKAPATSYFTIAPDWICEVLSPSTATVDRKEKMPLYAREGVQYAWLVDPIARTLEVYTLGEDRSWTLAGVHRDNAVVRVAPFESVELELSLLWQV
jgi:Uma2 family endonuclease